MSCSCSCSVRRVARPVAEATHERIRTVRTMLCAPVPPNAIRGLEGMKEADSILKGYGAVGLLIGGLAKAILNGITDSDQLRKHKDVDVLVSFKLECAKHPSQWEGGIDWWVSHSDLERPTNGRAHLLKNILYCANTKRGNGLYICEPGVLRKLSELEDHQFGTTQEVTFGPHAHQWHDVRDQIPDVGFEYMYADFAHGNYFGGEDPEEKMAVHCKPV